MKRPHSHTTDALGEAQMSLIFVSLGWAVTKIQADYGIDYDVQIFENGEATGVWFKVQLKSSESTSYSADQDFISQTLPVEHAIHYALEIEEPLFLIHSDVNNKRTYWSALQLDKNLLKQNLRELQKETVTIRISTSNELPQTLPSMLEALQKAQVMLATRKLSRTPVGEYADTITEHGSLKETIHDLGNKRDALKLQNAHDLAKSHDFGAARKETSSILQNEDCAIEIKFSALLKEIEIDWSEAQSNRVPQGELPQIRLRGAGRLQTLTKKGPPALKFYALITQKAAELEVLTFHDFGLYMNWKIQVAQGHPITALNRYIELNKSSQLVTRKYNQCIRLANYAAESRHSWALPTALLRIVEGAVSFTIKLRNQKDTADATAFAKAALDICRLAASIASANDDDDSLIKAVSCSLMLVNILPEESKILASDIHGKIKGNEARIIASELQARLMARNAGRVFEGDVPTSEEQIYENMATGIGINMGDPNDPVAKLVRRGIRDLNPGRALRGCDKTFISISGKVTIYERHLVSQLHLPTIGPKYIHCLLHNYSVENRELDEALKRFETKYCDKCPDHTPRPSEWVWSGEWQEEENQKQATFMEKFHKGRS